MARTGLQRLEAIPAVMDAGEEFKRRVTEAEGDAICLADLMAEAIGLERDARGHEVVGHDGRATVCAEEIIAAHCAVAARDAYLRARGSNSR